MQYQSMTDSSFMRLLLLKTFSNVVSVSYVLMWCDSLKNA